MAMPLPITRSAPVMGTQANRAEYLSPCALSVAAAHVLIDIAAAANTAAVQRVAFISRFLPSLAASLPPNGGGGHAWRAAVEGSQSAPRRVFPRRSRLFPIRRRRTAWNAGEIAHTRGIGVAPWPGVPLSTSPSPLRKEVP